MDWLRSHNIELPKSYAELEALLARIPSLDDLITNNKRPIFLTLVAIVVLGIVFLVVVSWILPNDFGDQAADDGEPPEPLIAADHAKDKKRHLLLAATGSVATIKIPQILSALAHHPRLSIRLIVSDSAKEFLQNQSPEQPSLRSIAQMENVDAVYTDADEWHPAWTRGRGILHIELRRWADVMVIAPLSADALAKLALGVSDNLVTSVARAWDTTGSLDAPRAGSPATEGGVKSIVVAPAMNTAMWRHPVTARHVATLEGEWGVKAGGWFEVLKPVEKELACGDTGAGAMREWKEIVAVIEQRLGLAKAEVGSAAASSSSQDDEYVAVDR